MFVTDIMYRKYVHVCLLYLCSLNGSTKQYHFTGMELILPQFLWWPCSSVQGLLLFRFPFPTPVWDSQMCLKLKLCLQGLCFHIPVSKCRKCTVWILQSSLQITLCVLLETEPRNFSLFYRANNPAMLYFETVFKLLMKMLKFSSCGRQLPDGWGYRDLLSLWKQVNFVVILLKQGFIPQSRLAWNCLCSTGWSQSPKAILLPQLSSPPKCWAWKHEPWQLVL